MSTIPIYPPSSNPLAPIPHSPSLSLPPSLLLLLLLLLLPQRHLLHEAHVVVFREVAIFLQIGPAVGGHGGEEVGDEVVGDEAVAEVEFGYVGLLGGV